MTINNHIIGNLGITFLATVLIILLSILVLRKVNATLLKGNNSLTKNLVFRHNGSLLNLGMCISLFLVYSIINFETPYSKYELQEIFDLPKTDIDIPITQFSSQAPISLPKPPLPIKAEVIKIAEVFELEKNSQEENSIETTDNSSNQNNAIGIADIEVKHAPMASVIPPVEDVFITDQMPVFPSCIENSLIEKDREECTKINLMKYVQNNLRYPSLAKQEGKVGTAVIRFKVTKSGEIGDIIVLRDPGFGMGEAAKIAVEKMIEDKMIWLPGKQKGRPVNVIYTLPVKFILN